MPEVINGPYIYFFQGGGVTTSYYCVYIYDRTFNIATEKDNPLHQSGPSDLPAEET